MVQNFHKCKMFQEHRQKQSKETIYIRHIVMKTHRKQILPANPQTTAVKEASRLTSGLHLALCFSRSNPPISLPAQQNTGGSHPHPTPSNVSHQSSLPNLPLLAHCYLPVPDFSRNTQVTAREACGVNSESLHLSLHYPKSNSPVSSQLYNRMSAVASPYALSPFLGNYLSRSSWNTLIFSFL